MNSRTDLDRILREWSDSRNASEVHLRKLAAGIRCEFAEGRFEQLREPEARKVGLLPRIAYAALGSALTLLLVSVWAMRVPQQSPTDAARLAAISAGRAATGGKLFAEMERLFARDFRWVAESNGDIDIGLGVLPGGEGRPSAPALVRLTVVVRNEGQEAWRPVWNADVIVRGEERVEISPNRAAKNRLALWVCPLDDGKLAVDTEVAFELPMEAKGKMESVVAPGVPTEILNLRSGGTEYRVFQTTTVLRQG